MRQGKLIVIEGTDGSGKATQSKQLLFHLEQEGHLTAYADFPQYGQKSAGLVENYLNGKYGSANEVNAKIASMFFAVDRYDASFGIRKNLGEGRIVVSNRYVSANMGHQASKIADRAQRKEFIDWLEELEYSFFNIPKPNLTILLYVPYTIAQELIELKEQRAYISGKKRDIHEEDEAYLRKSEEAYLELAKEKGWSVINCTQDNKILSIPQIHALVWDVVKKVVSE